MKTCQKDTGGSLKQGGVPTGPNGPNQDKLKHHNNDSIILSNRNPRVYTNINNKLINNKREGKTVPKQNAANKYKRNQSCPCFAIISVIIQEKITYGWYIQRAVLTKNKIFAQSISS